MRSQGQPARWLLLAALLAGCAHDTADSVSSPSTVPALPAIATPGVAVGVTVGSLLTVDATQGGTAFSDPAGGGLSYVITLTGQSAGLTTSGGVVRGALSAPGVAIVSIVATDALGRSVTDHFAIVAFEPGLALPVLPVTAFQYADDEVPIPPHFVAQTSEASVLSGDNTPANNRITDAGATLGRVLFFDPRLSANDRTSCGACHLPAVSYSDAAQFSVGFSGALTTRHAPSLVNARFYRRGRFFWDERAVTLEDQVLAPIQNASEMGLTLDALEYKLAATAYYKALFTTAFGTPDVNRARIAAALAQVSDGVHNTGLDASVIDSGAGNGAFKSPSLRNVGIRNRFMHDGRFTSLEQVVEFYDSGVQANPFLDARLKAIDGSPKRLGLSVPQKSALVAFLKTLTDSTFLTAPRFANPFVTPVVTPISAAVVIQSNSYNPPTLTVAPGAVVTFTNLDNARHSAQFDAPQIVSTPIFTSGTQSVTMLGVAGTFTYHCAVHGQAMRGTVVVR